MTANQLAIVVYGALSVFGLFVFGVLAGSTFGAALAIAMTFLIYVFQALQEEPEFNSELAINLLWVTIILFGFISFGLSIYAGL